MKQLLLLLSLLASLKAGASEPAATLKDTFRDQFLVGAALNPFQFGESNRTVAALVKKQFNTITPENVLKWGSVQPLPGEFDFSSADRFVQFGESNRMFIVGHTLVWHEQTPKWVFEDASGQPRTRAALLEQMRAHIFTVMGRYRGRIHGWDVVNEALNEDGTLRDTPWRKIIGDDYIQKAFEFAHQADPQAELYYNDYSLENSPKRQGALKIAKDLLAAGVPIAAVGIQGHVNLEWPTREQLSETFTDFEKLGIKTQITELDVDVLPRPNRDNTADVSRRVAGGARYNPYPKGLPAEVQTNLAARYAELFRVYRQHAANLKRVTFWGVTDRDSWLNNWPVHGRVSYPLLFDRANQPKPAFHSVLETATR